MTQRTAGVRKLRALLDGLANGRYLSLFYPSRQVSLREDSAMTDRSGNKLRTGPFDPLLPFRISLARRENGGIRPFRFHDHSRLRRVGSLGSGVASHRAKGIARRHAIGLDKRRTSSLQRRQFVQGSIRL